jgi:hypothetical protein
MAAPPAPPRARWRQFTVRLFEDTVSRAQYGTFEVVNRFGSVFVFAILPFLILRHILVCSWCDRSFILREIPVFNVMLMQDASIISGLCLVELLCSLYIPFRVIFCGVHHRQIVDATLERCKKLGKKPLNAFFKAIAAVIFLFVGGLSAMYLSTPNSIR